MSTLYGPGIESSPAVVRRVPGVAFARNVTVIITSGYVTLVHSE